MMDFCQVPHFEHLKISRKSKEEYHLNDTNDLKNRASKLLYRLKEVYNWAI
jgi:hypothetical protein